MSPTAPEGLPRASESAGFPADKDVLRARIAAARAADPHRSDADARRLPRLISACRGHATVACYVSVAPEPDTTALIDALTDAGVRVLLPVLKGHRDPAWAWHTTGTEWRPGWRGIPEPTGPALPSTALAECSFVWVSALAATLTGNRLGTGGGWYDRALTHAHPDAVRGTLVADHEVAPELPVEAWDLPVDLVVTPSAAHWTGARGVPRPRRGEQSAGPTR